LDLGSDSSVSKKDAKLGFVVNYTNLLLIPDPLATGIGITVNGSGISKKLFLLVKKGIIMSKKILNKVKQWLKEEVEDNQDVVDAKDNKEAEICSDGTDDIIYGRHECAEGLLNQIKKWEEEEEHKARIKNMPEEILVKSWVIE